MAKRNPFRTVQRRPVHAVTPRFRCTRSAGCVLSFGTHPLLKLKLAREKRDRARLMLIDDLDPSEDGRLPVPSPV